MKTIISPSDLARALGISESSIRRWCDDGQLRISRTAGGHRRIERQEAIRFVRQARLPVVRPDLLALPSRSPSDASETVDFAERLHAALMAGKADDAESLVVGQYLQGRSVAELCDGPLRGAMHAIGTLWPSDERAIFLEHRATGHCVRILETLRAQLPTKRDAPTALGGAAPDDPFVLPSLTVATVLADVGFQEVNLGPNTPFDVLNASAKESDAQLVWLSLTGRQPIRLMAHGVQRLAEQLGERGTLLVVGGQSARYYRLEPACNLHVFDTLQELSGFARAMLANHAARRANR